MLCHGHLHIHIPSSSRDAVEVDILEAAVLVMLLLVVLCVLSGKKETLGHPISLSSCTREALSCKMHQKLENQNCTLSHVRYFTMLNDRNTHSTIKLLTSSVIASQQLQAHIRAWKSRSPCSKKE